METVNYIYLVYVVIVSPLIYYLVSKLLSYLVEKARDNIKFRNDLLAFAYLVKDLGPNTAAFSVVSILVTNNQESTNTLVIIAFVGIGLHYLGRKIRDLIYKSSSNKTKRKSFSYRKLLGE